MKKLMLIFALTLSTASAFAEKDRGGGETVTPPRTDLPSLRTAIIQSKLPIVAFLNQEEWTFKQMNTGNADAWATLYPKLFSNKQTIFDVLNKTSIEIRDSSPCQDSDGSYTDGSIYSSFANSVCISSFRLASKLDAFNFDFETSALILHEMSHLLGATEAEAVSIQNAFSLSMRGNTFARLQLSLQMISSPFIN